MRKFLFLSVFALLISQETLGQSRISTDEYRGTEEAIARGVLEGNAIQTNFRNHGEYSRWNDAPWGIWPKSGGGSHLDGIGFIMAARVQGEKAKWSQYYGEGARDTLLNPVIINYRDAGVRVSPYIGDRWGWLPLNGFHNQQRYLGGEDYEPIPAISTDPSSWPAFWPDRIGETIDAGWEGSWNGFRGKGLVTGDQETFYVMDDFSDKEYAFGQEIEGPHSSAGVYHASPSDSSMGGLGLQTEVRTFQFKNYIANDILYTQYRVTNVSEKDLDETYATVYYDSGLGNDQNDDNARYDPDQNALYFWDANGIGTPTLVGDEEYATGYVAIVLLEHSLLENNGIDEDGDGMIDESKFNGPGEYLEGKAAIDAYLEEHYDMETFRENFVGLENFPAYANERWWTGDEDLDWVPFEDWNKNGIHEPNLGENLLYDLGRDGLGPNDANYPGPDEGEGDGIPTHGEPNFGEQDMMEAENRHPNLIGIFIFWDPFLNVNNIRDDTFMFGLLNLNTVEDEMEVAGEPTIDDDPQGFLGVGKFPLKAGSSTILQYALVFGGDEEELRTNIYRAKLGYESDFGRSALLTNNENSLESEVPTEASLSQNYPNPFNPTTNIEFSLSRSEVVTLEVFDITGRRVQSMISNQNYPAGTHSIQFDAGRLSSGVYMYRLEVAGEVFTRKLTLIK